MPVADTSVHMVLPIKYSQSHTTAIFPHAFRVIVRWFTMIKLFKSKGLLLESHLSSDIRAISRSEQVRMQLECSLIGPNMPKLCKNSVHAVSVGFIVIYHSQLVAFRCKTLTCVNICNISRIFPILPLDRIFLETIKIYVLQRFNSLRPSDAGMRQWNNHHRFSQWLVAWTAPSHYMNQCWNVVNWSLRNKLQWNSYRNYCIFIHENALESVVCEMAAMLSRPQCVKYM